MSTQVVKYSTCDRLQCGNCLPAGIKLCVAGALTDSGFGFLDATVTVEELIKVSCGQVTYRYTFTYEGLQLADPDVPLSATQITGVICESCWTSWVEAFVGETAQFFEEDLVYNKEDFLIKSNTGDGGDIFSATLCGGHSASEAHGASVFVGGNEGFNGQVIIKAGSIAGGDVFITATHSAADIRFQTVSLDRWVVDQLGALNNDATNGGDLVFNKASTNIQLKSGANGRTGSFTLNGATPVVVSNTSFDSTDIIMLFRNVIGGTPGAFNVTAKNVGVNFTVTGTALDTSTVNYVLTKVN